MAASFLLFALIVYGMGVGVSQSLMSLGGALFALWALVTFVQMLGRLHATPPRIKAAYALGLGLVIFLVANHALRERTDRFYDVLGALPLYLAPLAGFDPRWKRLSQKQIAIALGVCGLALGVGVLRAGHQFFVLGWPGTGFMRNPIYYAYNLFPAFVFFAELALRKKTWSFWTPRYSTLTAGLALAGIATAETRMIWALSAVYIAVRAWPLLTQRFGKKALIGLPLAGVIIATSLYAFSPKVRDKVERGFRSDDPSRVWRLVAWKHNWQLFVDHPVAGVGPYRNGINTARQPEYAGHWKPGHEIYAHSVLFQALADSGAVGTLLLAGFGVTLAMSGGAVAAIVLVFDAVLGGLTENIFNNSRAAHALFFYVLLAIVLRDFWSRGAGAPGPRSNNESP